MRRNGARDFRRPVSQRWLTEMAIYPGPEKLPSGLALVQAFVNWAEKHPER